jgi:hypothetical protein
MASHRRTPSQDTMTAIFRERSISEDAVYQARALLLP